MDILAWIVGILLAAMFSLSGGMKLADVGMVKQAREHLGFAKTQYQAIGGAEIAGVIGVLIGLISRNLEWLGVLASLGLAATMAGAVYFHRKAGDEPKEIAPAILSGVLAVAMIVLFFARPE